MGSWNRLRFGVTTLRKTALRLLDSLKQRPWESRSDVIERIAGHYMTCPLCRPVCSRLGFGLTFANRFALDFPVEVSVVGG